jgi:hypothetical protein
MLLQQPLQLHLKSACCALFLSIRNATDLAGATVVDNVVNGCNNVRLKHLLPVIAVSDSS